MTNSTTNAVTQWILSIAAYLARNEIPPAQYYATFIQDPELGRSLIDFINHLDEAEPEAEHAYYSAAIFAMDVYVSQLQTTIESGSKIAEKHLYQLMFNLALAIQERKHSLSFWLPVLNAFYEVHVELSTELKNAYLDLIEDEPMSQGDEETNAHSIRELIHELSNLSVFDIAEHFFAQSYAMPPEFFSDLVMDLYSIDEGHDIGLLTLLHPNPEVREQVVATLNHILPQITLSSISLTRLQAIKIWYPEPTQELIQSWIKQQRKKGVVFDHHKPTPTLKFQASEIDGGGAQGLFVHIKEGRQHKLCSLLLKIDVGIKDAWITPTISASDVARYHTESFDEKVTIREVDESYFILMVNHFLATTLEHNGMPNLHLLEIQEALGIPFTPQKIVLDDFIDELAVSIHPFTPEIVKESLKRSKNWTTTKSFTESWYIENQLLDKLVNRCCTFVDGVKVCQIEQAIELVFEEEMELQRHLWAFHFLWVALWCKAKPKKNEKTWQDAFIVAHAIHSGEPLNTIPIMREICRQSVINSVETMQERRTHLTQE